MVQEMPARGTLFGRSHPLASHIEGTDVLADRSHCCCADHVASRAIGRNAELGLSLLLVARRDVDAARVHGFGLRGGGTVLARMAVAGRGGKSGASSDHVWNCR